MKFYFTVPVWGTSHLDLFLNIGLPSLLSPHNIPALRALCEARFIIHTLPADEPRLAGSTCVQYLSKLLQLEIRLIHDPIESSWQTMSACHREVMREADLDDAAAVFVPPDVVWSDGSFSRLEQIAESGKTVIHLVGVCVNRDSFVDEITKWKAGNDGSTVTIPARQLAALGLKHLHRIAYVHFWDENGGGVGKDFHPAHMFWPVVNEGLLAQCFHLHPVVIHSEVKHVNFKNSIDDDLVHLACPDITSHHFVQNSDEVLCFEMSPPSRDISIPCRKGSIVDTLLWVYRNACNNQHLRQVRIPFRIYEKEPTPVLWQKCEASSSKIVSDITSRWEARFHRRLVGANIFLAREKSVNRCINKRWFKIFVRIIDALRGTGLLPFDPILGMLEGAIFMKAGWFCRADAIFQKCLCYFPKEVGLLSHCIITAAALGKTDEALLYSDRAVALDPRNIGLLVQHGGLAQALGLWERALEDWNKAIQFAPERAEFYANRAAVFACLGKAAEAEADRASSEMLGVGSRPESVVTDAQVS